MKTLSSLLLAIILALPVNVIAAPLHIACAANFRATLDKLAQVYQQSTGVRPLISTASTGTLYAQISHGAPFDLFLSADDIRPRQLIEHGLAIADSLSIYAVGQLILVGHRPLPASPDIDPIRALLDKPGVRVAMANPETAPYGMAGRATLQKLKLWPNSEHQSVPPTGMVPVFGNSVAQAFQFFSTGNTDFALVALSQWRNWPAAQATQRWLVPHDLYPAVRQAGVVITKAKQQQEALRFLRFMQTAQARRIMEADGYLPGKQP